MKKHLSTAAGVLLALAIALFALTALVYAAGTNAHLLQRMFLRHAPASATGLPEAEYGPVAQMTAAYLAGSEEDFQHRFTTQDGTMYLCFNRREQQHMADCAVLFRLCRTVMVASLGALLVMIGAGILLPALRRRMLRTCACTLGGVIALAVALLLWGLIDFSGLFVLFHRISFTNDLWLLNPATDLLIRLMPTSFFITYAAAIGAVWLACCLVCACIAAHLGRRLSPSNRGI